MPAPFSTLRSPLSARRLPGSWTVALSIVAMLAAGCSAEAESETPAGTDAVPERAAATATQLRAGDTLELPCADPIVAPVAGVQIVAEGQHRTIRPTRAGRHRWTCVGAGSSGTFDVVPSIPARLRWVAPDVVRVGASVAVRPTVTDVWDNAIERRAEVAVEPSELVEWVDEERVRFLAPGTVTVVATVAADPTPSPALRPWRPVLPAVTRSILVDAGPPRILLATPARGTVVQRTIASGVEVAGTVVESTPGVLLRVDGRPVEVAADGSFSTLVIPDRTGLSVIPVVATDRAGHETEIARAVLYGPLRDPSEGLADAVQVFLPKSVLDDDDVEDVDDIAAAIHLLLGSISIPRQRVNMGCHGDIVLSNVELTPRKVDLTPADRRFDVGVDLRNVSIELSGEACGCAFGHSVGCVDVGGSVSTEWVEAEIVVDVGKNGPTRVDARSIQLKMAPLSIHWSFLWGGLDWAIELFEREIRNEVETRIREVLLARIQEELNKVLEAALPVQSLALPPPLDASVMLQTRVAALRASDAGLQVELAARAADPRDDEATGRWLPIRPASRIGRAPSTRRTVRASGKPPALPTDKVGISVSLDVVNDAIFALYDRGVLDELTLDLGALGLDPRGVFDTVALSASLPPMLLPGREPGSLRLVIGDLHVVVETPFDVVEMYVSVDMEAAISFDETRNELVVVLTREGLEVHFEAASPNDAITMAATFHDVEEIVRLVIDRALAGRETRLALPVVNLGRIEGVPADRADELHLVESKLDVTRSGYLTVVGRLEAR